MMVEGETLEINAQENIVKHISGVSQGFIQILMAISIKPKFFIQSRKPRKTVRVIENVQILSNLRAENYFYLTVLEVSCFEL